MRLGERKRKWLRQGERRRKWPRLEESRRKWLRLRERVWNHYTGESILSIEH